LDVSRKNWQLRLGYQGRRDWGLGAGDAQALDPVGRFADDRINADLTYHNPKLTKNWDVTAQLSYLDTGLRPTSHNTVYPPGVSLGEGIYPRGVILDIDLFERHSRLDFSGFYSGFKNHIIRTGLGYYYGDLHKTTYTTNIGTNPKTGSSIPADSNLVDVSDTSYVIVPENARQNWYLFLQNTWSFTPKWELTTGIRYDHYSDFGSTANPRLALVWETNSKLTTKFLYGQAFRAPAFGELYLINNPVALGNPNLKAETIRTGELAIDYYPTDKLHFVLNLFNFKISDKILYLPDPSADTATAQNASTQTGRGLEAEIQWRLTKNFNIISNYSFQKAKDDNSEHDIGNAPHHQAYLRAKWLFSPNWYLTTQANWVAERERVLGDHRPNIDNYATTDLVLRYQSPKKQWNVGLSVRNLFDTDAREPSLPPDSTDILGIPNDLPLAGRNYFLEFSYHF
jgi:iron complex outermembrane receptor protein